MLQAFKDVLDWAEPEAGGRAILSVGELSIMTQLPLAAALPPPAPPEEFQLLGQAQLAAQSGGGDAGGSNGSGHGGNGSGHGGGHETLHGTFFEVSHACAS